MVLAYREPGRPIPVAPALYQSILVHVQCSPAGLQPTNGAGRQGLANALACDPGPRAASRDLPPDKRWFAVQCKRNREHGAAIQLHNQGFGIFLPLREKTWRHAHRIEVRRVPFFFGYLFVALDLDRDQWRSVNGTIGVQRLVTAGKDARPVPLPRGVVETWRSETDDQGCLRRVEPLRVGQAVRIQSGPLGDRLGEIVGLDDAGRVRVLIELLGGRIPVIMPRGKVMAAH